MRGVNALSLEGELAEISVRRTTPAGLPLVEGVIRHASTQVEAGLERMVTAEVPFVILGEEARVLSQSVLGAPVSVEGFVAAKSLKNRRLVLHVGTIRFLEGNENGF
ncbi:MAG: primosomal replication protein N [Rhodocyclaceae bacterium]|nr:primosomal replication protein N [Rhodocyclaceae bacterium]